MMLIGYANYMMLDVLVMCDWYTSILITDVTSLCPKVDFQMTLSLGLKFLAVGYDVRDVVGVTCSALGTGFLETFLWQT